MAHVRRLLDIVACTASFGPQPPPPPPPSPKDADAAKELSNSSSKLASGGRRTGSPPPLPKESAAKDAEAAAKEAAASAELEAEMSGACPRLGAFYEFFSLANLTPPLHCK